MSATADHPREDVVDLLVRMDVRSFLYEALYLTDGTELTTEQAALVRSATVHEVREARDRIAARLAKIVGTRPALAVVRGGADA